MVDIDRMVRGLAKPVQNAYLSAADGRCRKNSQREVVFIYHLRTTECEYDTAGGDPFKGCSVESFVGLQSAAFGAGVFGKGGRVQYHQVVFPFFACF